MIKHSVIVVRISKFTVSPGLHFKIDKSYWLISSAAESAFLTLRSPQA